MNARLSVWVVALLLLAGCSSGQASDEPQIGRYLGKVGYWTRVYAVVDHDAVCWLTEGNTGAAPSCLPCSQVPKVCAAQGGGS